MKQVLLTLFIISPFPVKFQNIRGLDYRATFFGRAQDFLYSPAGAVLLAIVIILLAVLLYSRYVTGRLKRNYREFTAPIIEESQRGNLDLSARIERTEKALDSFASAMQEYAGHMASHNRAIVGLSEASQALRTSTAEQNRILHRLSQTLEKERAVGEVSRVERAVKELEKRTVLVLQARDELENKIPQITAAPQIKPLIKVKIKSPPGCLVNSRALYSHEHFYAN
ncbi:MAG: hypothetical protein ABR958_00105 [Dehalococcoidales bacterium]